MTTHSRTLLKRLPVKNKTVCWLQAVRGKALDTSSTKLG
eukprot:CAMPEP_0194515090 /NCGR_PEP_ID=MMETSP0253-20130528/47679_1 /TAXON_ID=2966 /ORGANISM="Noctiluca scintillans" /LENGTH=38 /DNA_ID= /DNA_START= /DNA_END= /DNA_ORIENTATION=